MTLEPKTLSDLEIDDERSFSHVGLYADLKAIALAAELPFLVATPGSADATWNRALLYNLTFWNAAEPADVLSEARLPADVVMHVAWHHLARVHLLAREDAAGRPPAEALFLGEAIASAFDLYLVGRLLGRAPGSDFLETQVSAMAEVAEAAGASEADFERMLEQAAEEPERAFEALRSLLFDATRALFTSEGPADASVALAALEGRPFAPLLHHYELSNWVLYARAYAAGGEDGRAREVDRALREAGASLDWLEAKWVRPAVGGAAGS